MATRPRSRDNILAYGEVVEYIKKRTNVPAHHRSLHALLGEVYPYFVTYPILERYADLRLMTRKPHRPGLIGDIDP